MMAVSGPEQIGTNPDEKNDNSDRDAAERPNQTPRDDGEGNEDDKNGHNDH